MVEEAEDMHLGCRLAPPSSPGVTDLEVVTGPPRHFLEHEGVTVGIKKAGELDAPSDLFDGRDIHTFAYEFSASPLDSGNNKMEPLDRTRRRLLIDRQAGTNADRAGRTRRRQLHNSHPFGRSDVYVRDEAQLLDIERLGPIDINYRD